MAVSLLTPPLAHTLPQVAKGQEYRHRNRDSLDKILAIQTVPTFPSTRHTHTLSCAYNLEDRSYVERVNVLQYKGLMLYSRKG